MTPYARITLQRESHSDSRTISVTGIDASSGELVKEALLELLNKEELLGCQVCVLKNGTPLVDIAGGVMDPYERKPVGANTKFCSFSTTKGVSAAAIHLLVDNGLLELSQPVCKYWPAFGKNGKEAITVADILNHKAGLQNAGTREFSEDPFIACDASRVMEVMENAKPEVSSGYHYLSFGFLLDGIVRSVLNREQGLKELVESRITSRLEHKEFGIGVNDDDELSIATLVLKRDQLQKSAKKRRDIKSNESKASSRQDEEKPDQVLSSSSSSSSSTNATTSSDKNIPDNSKQTHISTSAGVRPLDAPSLLLNPTFFNNPRVRKSSIPAANGFFSARSLA